MINEYWLSSTLNVLSLLSNMKQYCISQSNPHICLVWRDDAATAKPIQHAPLHASSPVSVLTQETAHIPLLCGRYKR
jgi:hypothetical protein